MNFPDEILSNEEIVGLIQKYKKTNDSAVRDKILFSNLRFVYTIAHKYKRSAELRGFSFDDLVSDGVIGLIEAIDKFDDGRNVKFLTYAYWHVLKKITENFTIGTLDLPYHRRRALKDFEAKLSDSIINGVQFDADKACEEIGVSKKIIMDSLSKKDGATHGTDASLVNTACSKADTEQSIIDNIIYNDVKTIIDHDLDERERKVIVERYGLDGGDPRTLDEIAKDLGISYEYVRNIQNKVIDKLSKFVHRKKQHGKSQSIA